MHLTNHIRAFAVLVCIAFFCVSYGEDARNDENSRALRERLSRRLRNNGNQGSAKKPTSKPSSTRFKGWQPDNFLEKFGYLKKPRPNVQHSPKSRREAIKKFQRMYHLPVHGRLDKFTLDKMNRPRCGMPDMVPTETEIPAGVALDPSRNPENFYVPGYKWKKNRLTWKAHNYSPDLDSGTQRRAFYDAFQYWEDVSGLSFAETGADKGDINIKFGAYEHGDGAGNAFDGPGQILAHAFYPESGETHFDESETWTDNTDQGTNLKIVAVHELGHALGLGHSNVDGAVMAPFYQGYDPNFKLADDDIRGLQSLYGSNPTPRPTARPTSRPTPAPTPRPNPSPRPGGKPDTCTTKFGAVLQGHDYRIYVFYGKWIWRLNDYGVDPGFPRLANKYYDKCPINVGGAVYSWRTRFTYFFKGSYVFKYYGFNRIERRTMKSAGYPVNPQAAMMGRDGRIVLFKGSQYWTFDESRMDVVESRGREISALYTGVPPNIAAAVRLRDGYLYFFKGSKYRKYDEQARRVLPGYPKDKARPWMGDACGGYLPK